MWPFTKKTATGSPVVVVETPLGTIAPAQSINKAQAKLDTLTRSIAKHEGNPAMAETVKNMRKQCAVYKAQVQGLED